MRLQYALRHYLAQDGRDVIISWMRELRDNQAVSRIIACLDRVRHGNFGDHKAVAEGVWELRIDYGPGYRVYYCLDGEYIVLLLCGGDKSTQKADIENAVAYKKDYDRRAVNA
jgi:putative addiction module killer protein